jgi:hypothetical protein
MKRAARLARREERAIPVRRPVQSVPAPQAAIQTNPGARPRGVPTHLVLGACHELLTLGEEKSASAFCQTYQYLLIGNHIHKNDRLIFEKGPSTLAGAALISQTWKCQDTT